MTFALICLASLLLLGVVAAAASAFTSGGTDAPVAPAHDCASCSSVASGQCKIGCLLEEKRKADASAQAEQVS